MNSFYINTNRIFSTIRKYAWLFIFLVAFGGLWYPKLGLLMIPLMLGLGLLGFFKGKYWCGNLCPHGSLFDQFIMPISRNKKIPSFFKSKIMIVLAFSWFMFILTQRLIKVFALFGAAPFLDRLGFIFVMNYLMVTILGTIFALSVSSRTWCSFCPMGTFQVLSYKLGKLMGLNKKIDKKVTVCSIEKCHTCGKCARVCPMQLTPHLEFSENNQFENEMCIRCATCVENCPAGILTLANTDDGLKVVSEQDMTGYENRQSIKAKIISIVKLQEYINEYILEFKNPQKVDYQPGQFMLIKIQDKPLLFRAFTIASNNVDGKTVKIIIKKEPGGYGSEIIFNNFREGDMVDLEGPMGNELIVNKTAQKLLFVANGIGITPFIPLVKELLTTKNNVEEITLIYGVRYEDQFIYDNYFKQLEAEHSKFRYIKVVSRPHNEAEHKKGYVTNIIREMDLIGYKVYICGTKAMTVDTLKLLRDKGVEKEDVFHEAV